MFFGLQTLCLQWKNYENLQKTYIIYISSSVVYSCAIDALLWFLASSLHFSLDDLNNGQTSLLPFRF